MLPRPNTPLYNLTHEDNEIKAKTLKRWRRLNKYLVLPLYRCYLLPFFGFGRIFLILTTKGRKTGKKRRTPLEYHRIDNIIMVISGRGEDAGWMKNIRLNPDSVSVRHGFHRFKPKIDYVIDEDKKLQIIKWYVKKHGRSAKLLFGWDPKIDDLETTDFSNILRLISIIRFIRE
ncbi:MAG: nitroreductase family deazaflavin-dependent oxidoreductase [Promethearchaeota archaeon]